MAVLKNILSAILSMKFVDTVDTSGLISRKSS